MKELTRFFKGRFCSESLLLNGGNMLSERMSLFSFDAPFPLKYFMFILTEHHKVSFFNICFCVESTCKLSIDKPVFSCIPLLGRLQENTKPNKHVMKIDTRIILQK